MLHAIIPTSIMPALRKNIRQYHITIEAESVGLNRKFQTAIFKDHDNESLKNPIHDDKNAKGIPIDFGMPFVHVSHAITA